MVSATIISLNEEKKIGNAIKSLKGFVNEVVVVDCGSNDRTVEVARSLGAKVYFRKFDNFANQKNWAASKAKEEWILSIDGDEEIPDTLKQEISDSVNNKQYNGYLIPRRNFILGQEIKYSRWSPDKHIWLWRKDYGKWVGDVHEEVIVRGQVGQLKNSKIHNSHQSIAEFIEANNKYSQLEAQALYKKRINFSFWQMFWQPFFEFFIRYILKRGFLDGKKGFALAYIMAVYKITVAVKLWELQEKK